MIVGVNTDPQHFEDDLAAHARNLKAAGFTMVRFPLVYQTGVDLAAKFCDACIPLGLDPLPVFARESFNNPSGEWWGQFSYWRDMLWGVRHWQIGNEADHQSGSSWTMPEDRFSDLLDDARHALGPDAYLIAGGMVSGNPAYLDGVDLGPVDAIAVHPYGQRPQGWANANFGFGWAEELIARYQRFGKPVWVTEYGAPSFEMTDPQKRGDYYAMMLDTLAPYCAAAFPFKFEDNGVPGFGIEGTPALAAVSAAIANLQDTTPVVETETGSGFTGGPMKLEELAAIQHGGVYGTPVVIGGTKKKPTARIAWVNRPEHSFILEINGEADGPYLPLV